MNKSNSGRSFSFAPISNNETEILILGTLPSTKSLALNQYYANLRNKFWEIVVYITKSRKLPETYDEKIQLLLKNRIGVWDVVHQAQRKGSLDKNIFNEEPNKLNEFISNHNHLKLIGFNGQKAEQLFRKYFKKPKHIASIVLPSTSSAHSINFVEKCEKWKKIFENEKI